MSAPRRILTEDEKRQLRENWPQCYICGESLEGYADPEIEFDHIYDYASGYTQELSNFAPVHASNDPMKRNCHKAKGRKSPYEYKEELRIRDQLDRVHGLKDLCSNAIRRTKE